MAGGCFPPDCSSSGPSRGDPDYPVCASPLEPVPPVPHRLVADVDPALEKQVLDVPQAQRKTDIHHDHQADNLWRRIETAERTGRLVPRFARHSPQLAAAQDPCRIALTAPPSAPSIGEQLWEQSQEPKFYQVKSREIGGQGGIRTHGKLSPTTVFKTVALNHSATCPRRADAASASLQKLQVWCYAYEEYPMEAQVIAAVVNTINLYAIGVDTRQWQLFDEVFTADAVTDFGGPAVFSGLSAIKQLFETIHAPFDATQHATRGHHVRASGDIATCLCYYHARFLRDLPEGGNMFESAGWYDDKLVRTPQGWRIQHRTCRALWSGGNPAVLQTTPDVHVESVFHALHFEAREGRLGHLAAIAR
jgi:hypothetical protein